LSLGKGALKTESNLHWRASLPHTSQHDIKLGTRFLR